VNNPLNFVFYSSELQIKHNGYVLRVYGLLSHMTRIKSNKQQFDSLKIILELYHAGSITMIIKL